MAVRRDWALHRLDKACRYSLWWDAGRWHVAPLRDGRGCADGAEEPCEARSDDPVVRPDCT